MCKPHRLIAALAIVALLASGRADAANRVQWLQNLQPPSSWLNTQERAGYYAGLGELGLDLVGGSTTPFFTNFSITSAPGLYVNVGPATTNAIAALYQPGPIDATPFGSGANQLPADSHTIMHQGLLYAPVTLGPIIAPTVTGTSVIDLVECQVQVLDQTSTTVNFVSPTNVASSGPATRDRADVPVCQIKAGVAAASPVAPTVDTNFISIGSFIVAQGNTTISSGNIVNAQGFPGFLLATGANTTDTTNTAQTITATKTFTAPQNFASQINFTNTASPALTATPIIASDAQANPGMIVNIATASNGVVFYASGTPTGAAITAAGGLVGATANIAGLTTTNGALVNVVGAGTSAQTLDLHDTSSATTPDKFFRVASGALQVLNSGYSSVIATLTDSGKFSAPIIQGNTFLNAQNIAQGQCVTTDASHNLVAAAGPCGVSSGSITSVVGTGNITASNVAGGVTVGEVASPTFATAATAGLFYLGSDLNYSFNRAGSVFTLTPLNSSAIPSLNVAGGFFTGASQYYSNQAIVAGPVTANYGFGSVQPISLYDGGTTNNYTWLYGTGLTEGASVYGPVNANISGRVNAGSASISGAVTASTFTGSGAGLTSLSASNLTTGTLGLANGGTGSTTKNFVDLSTAQTVAGAKNFTTSLNASAGLTTTNAAVSGQLSFGGPFIANDSSATPGLNFIVPAATPSYSYRFFENGTNTQDAQINASGVTVGTSVYGPTSAVVNGDIQTTSGNFTSAVNTPIKLCPQGVCSVTIATGGAVTTTSGLIVGGLTAAGANQTAIGSAGGNSALRTGSGNFILQDATGANNWLNINASGALFEGTVTTQSAFLVGSAQIDAPGTGTVVAGVGCGLLRIAQVNVASRACFDTSSNLGIGGSYYAASERRLKDHIEPLSGPEALAWIESTEWSKFAYKTEHAKAWSHVGLIADNSPVAFAGPNHNHIDVNAVASAAAVAVKYQQIQIDHMQERLVALEKARPVEEHGWFYKLVHVW